MALPFSFSINTSPTGGQLDADLAALGAMGVISCASAGTNTITLTPNANQPDVPVYVNASLFSFAGPNNSSGPVNALVGALSPLPVYVPSGVQANSGDISGGSPYIVMFLSALNSGNGGFQIVSSVPATGAVAAGLGSAKGLAVTNNVSTPSTKIKVTALQAILVNGTGVPIFLSGASAPNVVIDLTTVGANGMDTGSRPTSGWVYCYLISTGALTAGLATITAPGSGNPSLPSGYLYFAFVGAMYCDGSQNLLRSLQQGRTGQYQIASATNTATVPISANGIKGTYSATSPTLSAITVAGNTGTVPLTAGEIIVTAANKWKNGNLSNLIVAPSTAWGGTNNGPEGSAGQIYPVFLLNLTAASVQATMVLESTAIGVASDATGAAVATLGWRDYYVNA